MTDIEKYKLTNFLRLNECAYFFKNNNKKITKKDTEGLFKKILNSDKDKRVFTKIYKREYPINDKVINYSLLIFSFKTNPSFFEFTDDEVPSVLQEKKIAYLLIVEINEIIVIIKRNIYNISHFITKLTPINADTLTGILIDKNTVFQKVKLSNMNMSENSIRNKSYEANDLTKCMPLFGANHTVINSTRFSNSNGIFTVNINTSKLNETGSKLNLTELLEWMYQIAQKINSHKNVNSFLSHFATPIQLGRKNEYLKPKHLLIDIFKVYEYIQSHDSEIILKKGNKSINIQSKFNKVLSNGIDCIDLENTTNPQLNKHKKIEIKETGGKFKIYCKDSIYDSIYLKKEDNYIKLVDIINQRGYYSIGFEDCSYIYTQHQLYRNTKIKEEFEYILSTIEAIDEINNVTSEKGQCTFPKELQDDFCKNSMFYIVENKIFEDADLILCDDLGNEWADHIIITEKGNRISYIHSKCCNQNETYLSASKFQEVIGQATKNIGNMNPNDEEMEKKIKNFKGKWNNTNICKCRKGKLDQYKSLFKKINSKPNRIKEICIAVNFLSKKELEYAFNNIKEEKKIKQENSTIQLAWLLSGFISTCKEADLNCRIFCKP